MLYNPREALFFVSYFTGFLISVNRFYFRSVLYGHSGSFLFTVTVTGSINDM